MALVSTIHMKIEKSDKPDEVRDRIILELEASKSKRFSNESTLAFLVEETKGVKIIGSSTNLPEDHTPDRP
jgi:hypothetical protein